MENKKSKRKPSQKRYYWLKLKEDWFSGTTEKYLKSLPAGDKVFIGNTPEYIKKIDIENNEIALVINPSDNTTLNLSIKEFENTINSNPLNEQLIEKNKENDLKELAKITEINSFTESDGDNEKHDIFKIPIDLKEDSTGLKKKYEENIAAIKLLYSLEKEGRDATDEEKLIL